MGVGAGIDYSRFTPKDLRVRFEEQNSELSRTVNSIRNREQRVRGGSPEVEDYTVACQKIQTIVAAIEPILTEVAKRLAQPEPSFLGVRQSYWPRIFTGCAAAFPATSYVVKYTNSTGSVYPDVGYGLGVLSAALAAYVYEQDKSRTGDVQVLRSLLERRSDVEAAKDIVLFIGTVADPASLADASFHNLCRRIVACSDPGLRDGYVKNLRAQILAVKDTTQKARLLHIFGQYVEERASDLSRHSATHPSAQRRDLTRDASGAASYGSAHPYSVGSSLSAEGAAVDPRVVTVVIQP